MSWQSIVLASLVVFLLSGTASFTTTRLLTGSPSKVSAADKQVSRSRADIKPVRSSRPDAVASTATAR